MKSSKLPSKKLSQQSLAQVLHDLSTPATVISMNLDLLKLHLENFPDPELKKYLQRLIQGSEKLNQVIKLAQKQGEK